MKKKKIAIGIIFILLLCGGITIYYMQKPSDRVLTQNEIEEYSKYKLTISKNTTREDIKEWCEKPEEGYIDERKYTTYQSKNLEQFLYDYDEMVGIEEMDNTLYISYTTTDKLNVCLEYNDEGFQSMGIYNTKKDMLVSMDNNGGKAS